MDAEGASREVRTKAWRDYGEAQKVNREFAAERLEIFAGLAFRRSRLDENACRLADELIGKCNLGISLDDCEWVTIPAPKEALGRTLARIVRLRFPEWTVWALPLVAHASPGNGKLVAPTIPGTSLMRDVLNAAWLARLYLPNSREAIADIALEMCKLITERRSRFTNYNK